MGAFVRVCLGGRVRACVWVCACVHMCAWVCETVKQHCHMPHYNLYAMIRTNLTGIARNNSDELERLVKKGIGWPN